MRAYAIDSVVEYPRARPSDAIAVALRMDAPILVLEAVLEKAKAGSVEGKDPLTTLLENMGPEDFGKYKM